MNVVCIIQARVSSNRLPGKVLMKILDTPILEHIVNFLKFSKSIDKIVIATSDENNDNSVCDLAESIGIDFFRGSLHDVLKRYYDCATKFNADLIVRITADNPLIDPELVDNVINTCKKFECDYASNMIQQSFPSGYLVEVLTYSTLQNLYHTQHDLDSREHVTPHIRKNPNLFTTKQIFAPKNMDRPNWRLTLDYQEDFLLISEIFAHLFKQNSFIKYEQVFNLLNSNPNLLKINRHH